MCDSVHRNGEPGGWRVRQVHRSATAVRIAANRVMEQCEDGRRHLGLVAEPSDSRSGYFMVYVPKALALNGHTLLSTFGSFTETL